MNKDQIKILLDKRSKNEILREEIERLQRKYYDEDRANNLSCDHITPDGVPTLPYGVQGICSICGCYICLYKK